jgi:four helix bundle protein
MEQEKKFMAENEEKGLETLQVWQKAIALAVKICREIVPMLPAEEKWGMAIQLRRSSQSVPANIAEGFGRYYYQDGVRFCYIARGSLEETYSHLTLANKLDYIPGIVYLDVVEDIQELRRMLHGYIAFLKKSKRGEHEPGVSKNVHEESDPYFTDLPDADSPSA